MRVIAGRLGGRRLAAPPGRGTRPTADRVRESLFSILGPLEGLRVLDLFAGSGALGIEALSRGAARAVFVDSDARAGRVIRRNLSELGLAAPMHVADALAYLRWPDPGGPFDLIFLDPPYSSGPRLAAKLSERLVAVLAPHARIVSESDKHAPVELTLPMVDERTYGSTRIAIHRAP